MGKNVLQEVQLLLGTLKDTASVLGVDRRTIERYNAAGTPAAAADFATIVDMATEEDSISAPSKVQSLLYDLGILQTPPKIRPVTQLPAAQDVTEKSNTSLEVNPNEI